MPQKLVALLAKAAAVHQFLDEQVDTSTGKGAAEGGTADELSD